MLDYSVANLSVFFQVASGLIDLVHVTLGIDIDNQDNYLAEIVDEIIPNATKTRAKRVVATKAKKVIVEESSEEEEDDEDAGDESEDSFTEE